MYGFVTIIKTNGDYESSLGVKVKNIKERERDQRDVQLDKDRQDKGEIDVRWRGKSRVHTADITGGNETLG